MDLRIGYVAGRGYDDRDSSVPAERQVLGEMAEVPNRSYGGGGLETDGTCIKLSATLPFYAEEAEGRRTARVLEP